MKRTVLSIMIVFFAVSGLLAAETKKTADNAERKGAIKITGSGSVEITKESIAPTPVTKTVRPLSYFDKEADSKEAMPRIDIEEAEMLYKSGKALFVDARGAFEYDDAHIKGAVSIPAGDAVKRIEALKDELKDKILVTYCHGAGCHLADKTANALFDAGFKKTVVFFGGWPKWTAANQVVDGKKTKDGKLQ